ncbi:MAG: hypothetical protein MSIBF_00865 [Candidatus Altiarchaeales archaeon IMC4]|nr:MAG: hypothetical protein MSIBF_00865 [Candidatus Altiarchaeales archaeon IMC4]
MQYVKIPNERIAVLVGKNGATKESIEKKTNTKISVTDTSVSVVGAAIDEWVAKDVVLAIGRGFSPENALRLLKENNTIEILRIGDIARSKNDLDRLKGRIIGEGGKTRKTIEEMTGCSVSVYGKTAAIIGLADDVYTAKEAIVKLLDGAQHTSVYKFLEKKRVEGKPMIL